MASCLPHVGEQETAVGYYWRLRRSVSKATSPRNICESINCPSHVNNSETSAASLAWDASSARALLFIPLLVEEAKGLAYT